MHRCLQTASSASRQCGTPLRAFAAAAAGSERPFRVLGVQQVALGGADKFKLRALWVDLFGLQLSHSFQSEKENVDEDVLVLGQGPTAVEVDLMQPLDEEKRPRVDKPPLNHIGLWIDDLPTAVEWLGEQGLRFAPGGIRPGASGHNICFVHPRGSEEKPISGEGVLIELVQAPEAVVEFYDAVQRGSDK